MSNEPKPVPPTEEKPQVSPGGGWFLVIIGVALLAVIALGALVR